MTFALAFAALFLCAAAHAVTGFGYVLLAVPLLAFLFEPHTAVASAILAGTLIAVAAGVRERRHVDVASFTRLTLAALLGVPVGLYVFTHVAAEVLLVIIGVITISTTAVLASRVTLRAGRLTDVAAGVVSGALVTTTGTNGPPLVLALQAKRLPPLTTRATLQALFTVQGAVAAIGLALTGQITPVVSALVGMSIVASLLGWRAGDAIFRRLSPGHLRALILLVLLASGTTLLVRGLGPASGAG